MGTPSLLRPNTIHIDSTPRLVTKFEDPDREEKELSFLEGLPRSGTPQLSRERSGTPLLDRRELSPINLVLEVVQTSSPVSGGASPTAEDLTGKNSPVQDMYVAKYDYKASEDTDELTFGEGDHITIVQRADNGWWQGLINEHYGWFPEAYVEPLATVKSTTDFVSSCDTESSKDPLDEPPFDLGPRKMTEVTAGTSEELEVTG